MNKIIKAITIMLTLGVVGVSISLVDGVVDGINKANQEKEIKMAQDKLYKEINDKIELEQIEHERRLRENKRKNAKDNETSANDEEDFFAGTLDDEISRLKEEQKRIRKEIYGTKNDNKNEN